MFEKSLKQRDSSPKKEMHSSFTLSQVVPNRYEYEFLLNIKDIL